jgi:negative regulator of sigma E activity
MPLRPRRSWRSRFLELVLWAGVSLATAVILVSLSEKLLPTNF